MHYCWERNREQFLWRRVWRFLKSESSGASVHNPACRYGAKEFSVGRPRGVCGLGSEQNYSGSSLGGGSRQCGMAGYRGAGPGARAARSLQEPGAWRVAGLQGALLREESRVPCGSPRSSNLVKIPETRI